MACIAMLILHQSCEQRGLHVIGTKVANNADHMLVARLDGSTPHVIRHNANIKWLCRLMWQTGDKMLLGSTAVAGLLRLLVTNRLFWLTNMARLLDLIATARLLALTSTARLLFLTATARLLIPTACNGLLRLTFSGSLLWTLLLINEDIVGMRLLKYEVASASGC